MLASLRRKIRDSEHDSEGISVKLHFAGSYIIVSNRVLRAIVSQCGVFRAVGEVPRNAWLRYPRYVVSHTTVAVRAPEWWRGKCACQVMCGMHHFSVHFVDICVS